MTDLKTETPIVLVPGFLCDERLWSYQLRFLSPSAPCTVVDLRNKKTLKEMVQALRAIPFPQFHLIGFSMGGYVSQAFAAQYPERLHQLILIGTTGASLSEKAIKARTRMKSLLEKVEYAGLSDAELKIYLHPKSYEKPEVRETVRAMAASNTSEMYLGQMSATLDRRDFKPQLSQFKHQITLIGGAEDKMAPPEQMEALHQALPKSRLHLIAECGHFVPLEKPQELNDLLFEVL